MFAWVALSLFWRCSRRAVSWYDLRPQRLWGSIGRTNSNNMADSSKPRAKKGSHGRCDCRRRYRCIRLFKDSLIVKFSAFLDLGCSLESRNAPCLLTFVLFHRTIPKSFVVPGRTKFRTWRISGAFVGKIIPF